VAEGILDCRGRATAVFPLALSTGGLWAKRISKRVIARDCPFLTLAAASIVRTYYVCQT
jgi:hypothetical protein